MIHKTKLKNGEELVSYQFGQGEKHILLIHGNMSAAIHWKDLVEVLADQYTITTVDLRGFGDSSYHTPIDSLLDFALDLKEFTEIHDFSYDLVCGWSTGGGVALEMARIMASRVKKVLLLSSVGIKGYAMYAKDEAYQPILTQRIHTKSDIAKDPVQVVPVLEAYKQKDASVLRAIWDFMIYHNQKPKEEDYAMYLEAMLKQRNLVDVDYALVHFNLSDEENGVTAGTGHIHDIHCPIILVHGTLDRVIPFTEALAYKEVLKEQAVLVPVEEAGHSVLTDNLDILKQTIIETV